MAAEVASPTTVPSDKVAYTSFETTEIGVDWCVNQSVETDRSGLWLYIIDALGTGYFSIGFSADSPEQTLIHRSFLDGSIIDQRSLTGFFSGYINQSSWAWIPSGDGPGDGLIWSDEGETRSLSIELREERHVPDAPSSIADDGSVVAFGVWLNGRPFDYEPEPPLETRIIDVATNDVLAVFDGYALLLPDGERVIAWDGETWSVQDLATGSVEARLHGPGEFDFRPFDISPDQRLLSVAHGQSGTRATTIYDLEDLGTPVTDFEEPVLSSSPDGRFVFSANDPGYDADGRERSQMLLIRDTASGDVVLGPFEKPYPHRWGLVFDHRRSMRGRAAFSHDSRYAATWAETEAGVGIHVLDLGAGKVLDVIPSNSGSYVQFDPVDDTLYFTDRVTGQFGHVDLSDGKVLIGEPLFSYQDYQRFAAAEDVVVYSGPDGSSVRCDLRTADDSPGDGSGPPLPRSDPSEAITEDMVRNAIIPAGHCESESEAVQLTDGSLVVSLSRGAVTKWVDDDDIVVHDLNGDDVDDAIFIVKCNFGGNAVFDSLVLWLAGHDTQLLGLEPATSGVRAGGGFLKDLASIEATGNLVRVRWFGALPGDGNCCPSIEMDSLHRVTRLGEFRFIRNEAGNEASERFEDLSFGL